MKKKNTKNTEPKTVEEQLTKYKRLAIKRKQRIVEMEQEYMDEIKTLEDKHAAYLDDLIANHKRNQNQELDVYKHKYKYTTGALVLVIIVLLITVIASYNREPVRSNKSGRWLTADDSVGLVVDTVKPVPAPTPVKTKAKQVNHNVVTSTAMWGIPDSVAPSDAQTKSSDAQAKEVDKSEAKDSTSTSP